MSRAGSRLIHALEGVGIQLLRDQISVTSAVSSSAREVARLPRDEVLAGTINDIGRDTSEAVGAAFKEARGAVRKEIHELHRLLIADHYRALDEIRQQAWTRNADAAVPPPVEGPVAELSEAAAHLLQKAEAVHVDRQGFPTDEDMCRDLDALVAEFPHLMTKTQLGESAEGHPIVKYMISGGPEHALVIGGVHSNEPVGNITAVQLARLLASDDDLREALGYTWHIVACVDPDAMRLNNDWFEQTHFARNREEHRSARPEQPLMTVRRLGHPRYISHELREGEVSAITGPAERFGDDLAFGIELHNGETSTFFAVSEGVRRLPGEVQEALYADLAATAERCGLPVTRSLLEEVHIEPSPNPGIVDIEMDVGSLAGVTRFADYFSDVPMMHPDVALSVHPAFMDHTPSGMTFAEVLTEEYLPAMREALDVVTPALRELRLHAKDGLEGDAARRAAAANEGARTLAALIKQAERVAESPAAQRGATVSERHSMLDWAHGMFVRRAALFTRKAMEDGLGVDPSPRLAAAHAKLMEHELEWAQRAEDITGPAVPPAHAATVQLASILIMAHHLRRAGR